MDNEMSSKEENTKHRRKKRMQNVSVEYSFTLSIRGYVSAQLSKIANNNTNFFLRSDVLEKIAV